MTSRNIAVGRVNIDEGGMRALLKLSRGDMRRALNILQSCTSAFDVVTSDNIHATTGSPLPSDVEDIVKWLLNEPFATAFHRTLQLKTSKGLAMADLLLEIHAFVILVNEHSCRSRRFGSLLVLKFVFLRGGALQLEMPSSSRIFLLDRLATIE